MSEGLWGHVAVVTGASRGIGRAIALALAEDGATVCLVGREPETLAAVAAVAAIAPQASPPRCYQVDLTEDAEVGAFSERVQGDLGHVDVLVHSAGLIFRGPFESAPVDELDLQYRANVRAPYLLTQLLLPTLRSRRGQIVFVNSTVGLQARASVSQFAATQHALKALADGLRDEVNADGVRVLNVYPGRTATPRQEAIFESEGTPYRPELLMQPEDVAAVVVNALRLPRTAEVTQINIRPELKSY